MKNSVKFILGLVLVLFVTQTAFSQSKDTKACTSVNLSRNIEFDGTSEKQEVNIAVSEGNDKLCFGISSTLQSGDLTVEIYDPNGKDYGNFSIEGQSSSSAKNKDMVCGQMNKEIKDPIQGNWLVKLIPSKAKGQIAINTMQMQENK